jgi:GNAT superfamily N-acetyltransferase
MSSGTVHVSRADRSSVRPEELEALLHRAYVDGGFTDPKVAASIFAAEAVLARGQLLVTRDEPTGALTGMVIVVFPGTPARRMGASDEVEVHLLAVSPAHRKAGIGQALVDAATELARLTGFGKMVLWTQPAMRDAQRLYERCGFVRAPARDFGSPSPAYLVFEKQLG